MENNKVKIEGKVNKTSDVEYTVQAVGNSEKPIIVVFDTTTSYQVVKLDVNQLSTAGGISWINNFGIVDSSGNYVDSVNYTVFLPARANATFIYDSGHGPKTDKVPTPRGRKPERPGMVQVDFTMGDPGVGWK